MEMEDGKKFGVFHFLKDDSVAVVHANWVKGSVCFWPNKTTSKKLKALTMEGKLPELGWTELPFTSLGWYDSYEKARLKLPIAEEASDLRSDVELGRGKRKKTRKLVSSDSEVEIQEGYIPPKPPTPPCLGERSDQAKKSSRLIFSGHEAVVHSRSHGAGRQKAKESRPISNKGQALRRISRSCEQSSQGVHGSRPVSRERESSHGRQLKSPEWSSRWAHGSRSVSREFEELPWRRSLSPRHSTQQAHGSCPSHHEVESSLGRCSAMSPEALSQHVHGSPPVSRERKSSYGRQSKSPERSRSGVHGSRSVSREFEELPWRRSLSPRHSTQQAHGSRPSHHEVESSLGRCSAMSPEALNQHVHGPVPSAGRPRDITAHMPPGAISGPQWTDFMTQVLRMLHTLKQRQQQQSEQLALLANMLDSVLPAPTEPLVVAPLKDLEEFLAYEKVLAASDEKKLQLKRYIKIIGGDDAKEKTSRILKKLLTYDIGVAFTWYGTKDKRRFCDLQFCQLMCGGLTEQQNKKEAEVTLKDIEKTTMTWLRHAKERLDNCQKRGAAQMAHPEEDEDD
ncbi:uncharacterized protein ISCGN_009060 [Ixodes scapularis]